eukprot:418719-Pleurochrysis_carterae.AAC.2
MALGMAAWRAQQRAAAWLDRRCRKHSRGIGCVACPVEGIRQRGPRAALCGSLGTFIAPGAVAIKMLVDQQNVHVSPTHRARTQARARRSCLAGPLGACLALCSLCRTNLSLFCSLTAILFQETQHESALDGTMLESECLVLSMLTIQFCPWHAPLHATWMPLCGHGQ